MSVDRSSDDALDERIRLLTRRVVDAAPVAPDLAPVLLERSVGGRRGVEGVRRPMLVAAAVIVVVAAFAAGALWRRAQAPVPVSTADGPSVALLGRRSADGELVGLVAGAAGEVVTLGGRPTERAPVDTKCFGTESSSPVCLAPSASAVSFGILNPEQADAVLVVMAPGDTAQVSVSVDGAVVWQRPIEGLAAVPLADLPAGLRLEAGSALVIEAFDGSGKLLARQEMN